MMNRRGFLARLIAAPVVAMAILRPRLSEQVIGSFGEEPTVVGVSTALQRGDVITFSDCFALNPITRSSTQQLQRFVVTADITQGDILSTKDIYPPLLMEGPYANVIGPAFGESIDGRSVHLVPWRVMTDAH